MIEMAEADPPNDLQYTPPNRPGFDGDVIEVYKVVFETPKRAFSNEYVLGYENKYGPTEESFNRA